MNSGKMTPTECRAVLSLSSIMGLRMLGLFMVLPVFALYARELKGASPFLIGWALGIYGLSQAIFQIPFGLLSDRLGRKPIIAFGILIFILGSLLSGIAHSITLMIIGRALQGVGAVGSTILAFLSDLTREEQRTKAMAVSGITIGFSFSLAMLVGPLLTKWINVSSLFFLAGAFGIVGLIVLYLYVPTPQIIRSRRDSEPELKVFLKLLIAPELAKLNVGIFILHTIFTASFIVLPISLLTFLGLEAKHQWILYVPTLFIAFLITLCCVHFAERRQILKPYFLASIFTLSLSEFFFYFIDKNIFFAACGLCLFFSGFSLLEAFLPSLISRTAPITRKGTALGLFSCSQFLGIFVGGVLGGWLYGKFGFSGVYFFSIVLALFWLVLAFFMQSPRYLTTQMWRISPSLRSEWASIAAKLNIIPGMVEVTFIAEEGVAYLKSERRTLQDPDFLRLKERLQSE